MSSISDFLIPAERIRNGYFYCFVYKPYNYEVKMDQTPFIYCIGPSTSRLNNFYALNFHHLPLSVRLKLLEKMDDYKHFTSNEQFLYTTEELNKMVPGCKIAVREYNRKRIYQPYRVPADKVKYFFYGEGTKVVVPGDTEFELTSTDERE